MIIVYAKHCLCKSKDKNLLRLLRTLDDVEVRRTVLSKEWQLEADSWGVSMPFYIYEGSQVVHDFYGLVK